MVVGLLGVLKAGGAYLPLDPGSPPARLSFMLADAGVKVVLTQRELQAVVPAGVVEVILVDGAWEAIGSEREENPGRRAVGENLAYVIYTSGSTGRPKGVLIEHRQMLNYSAAISERVGYRSGGMAMVQPLTVDSCGTVLYPSLSQGGALHLVSKERALDGAGLAEYLRREQIECLKIAPSHLGALAKEVGVGELLPRGQLIIGGEASSWEFVERLAAAAGGCRVFNHYGPTETTVGILCYEVGEDRGATGNVPLGRPLGNMEVYVLDGEMEVVAEGVLGELYLGGAAVGRGYLGRVELTAEKFVPHPYSAQPGQRLYRSGDVGRYGREGNIEYVGRRDEQVKVRGFRVELGEIEAALREHEQVSEALVVAQGEAGADKRLVGYVVWTAGAEVGVEELRKSLRQRLPEYMVPTALVELSELPLTAHGKVDCQALPAPDESHRQTRSTDFVPPQTPAEKIVAGIWAVLLNIPEETISVNDNFFELGGHSLLTTQLRSRLSEVFMIEIPLRRFFEVTTIGEMTSSIAELLGGRELTDEIAQTQIEIQQLSAQHAKILLSELSKELDG